MKLTSKTLIIILATLVFLFTGLYISANMLLIESYSTLETNDVTDHMERVINAYKADVDGMHAHTTDYAFWDDSSVYITDHNDDYIQSNMVPSIFDNLDIQLILYIDTKGDLVYGRMLPPGGDRLEPITPEIKERIMADPLLSSHPSPESSAQGIVLVPGQDPIIVASRPILTSNCEGPVLGALIMGKFLTTAQIERLAGTTNLPVAAISLESADISDVTHTALLKHSIAVLPVNQTIITGYALLSDIHNQPALALKVDLPRTIMQQAYSTISYLLISLITIGGVFGLLALFILRQLILEPIGELNWKVTSITSSRDFSRRIAVKGNDEIAAFAGNIDSMLAEIEQSQKILRESEEKFHTLADSLPQIVVEADREGRITFINQASTDVFETLSEEERNIFNPVLYADETEREKVIAYARQVLNGETTRAAEFSMRGKENQLIPMIVHATPVVQEGNVVGLRAIASDISSVKSIQSELERSVAEKDTLMKELHHRVKNNLQVISALISLQEEYVTDTTVLTALKDAQKRIMSMALLHEKLYRSEDMFHLDVAGYISHLAGHLSMIYEAEARNVEITTDVHVTDLDIDTAIPCGLIISEIVSNSLKYAFPDNRGGTIAIRMNEDENGTITLTVSDNGVGFPPGLNIRESPSLGTHLIRMLSENQLEGTLAIETAGGVAYTISFRRKKHSPHT
ncbi:MAG: PAS domain S-box protein [Methanomicrobiaceae archaeon]|nr:PAS domain S-box protein [Methanomicrobiaceae archaeon]